MEELNQEILNTFKKVEINIPLLDVVKQIPKYAKFLKELYTYKRRIRDNEVVNLGRNVSSLVKKHIEVPQKCKDPGMFFVPCVIGNSKFDNAMLDLRASINVMPLSVVTSLSLGPLMTMGMVIQLAKRSIVNPAGVLKDDLVLVDKLIFPTDFYILDMKDEEGIKSSTIILGRPFMMTPRIKIDVHVGTLTMKIGDEKVHFNGLEAMKHPIEEHSLFCIDLLSDIEDAVSIDDTSMASECDVEVAEITLGSKILPSVVQPPILEGGKLPVIISALLSDEQEKRLLQVIRDHKKAIGWTLADIPSISSFFCMHKILLEEDAKPVRQPQRRLNPQLMEVVKKEVTKLLQAGIIYQISDSTWVSPVHVVPKKSGVIVVKNEKDELIPTRIQNSWRVCIDYRRLNHVTRKDHFPLPFMDQMLDRSTGKSHYCFLDGFSGYFQICIALEDQHKTTFTCPFGTYAYRKMPFGLCNALGTFQRCMLSIFTDLLEHCIEVFKDDFSVYGSSFDNCLANLARVLQRCEETNLVLNFEKCHFMVEQGIVLGHVVSRNGIYRRFIQDFSKIANPLSSLLQKDVPFNFGEKCKAAFDSLKRALTTTPVIQPPDWTLPFELMCDASNFAVGAVLAQRNGKLPHVIYYSSRTLDTAQANYTTFEKDLLAVVFALDKFRSYILGSKVIVYTDHDALKFLLKKADSKPRLIRWMLLLQDFDIEIRHRSGAHNLVADHLSRNEKEEDEIPIQDDFPNEVLLTLTFFADIVNYLAVSVVPPSFSKSERAKLKSEVKYYVWDEPFLWRIGSDQVMRRCVC
ncbi:hypothetical protein V8G54_024773 [Vigna mungo]|uniref:RNA-directed DNA polymerase n=1 Tax=Vigna mungo TaxID=3915 RepID=A0AAQ3N7I7_VIGMU